MSTTEQELLAQIWARPDDRAVLSVYADWLVEEGDAARGQYMQLWLLNAPTPAQVRLRDWLFIEHQHEWLGAARPLVSRWTESAASPGFFAHVMCSAENLVRGFEAIRALGPRIQVQLEPPRSPNAVKALGGLPLGRLYRLELYEDSLTPWLDDELLAQVGPALEGLRSLALYPSEWGVTFRGWERFRPYLSTVEQLDLGLGADPERWVELLLASPTLTTLKRLSLPEWIAPELKRALETAMKGRQLAFRPEPRRRFDPILQPVG